MIPTIDSLNNVWRGKNFYKQDLVKGYDNQGREHIFIDGEYVGYSHMVTREVNGVTKKSYETVHYEP